MNNDNRHLDAIRDPLSSDWAASRGASSLGWDRATHAACDAWNRSSPSN